MASKFKLDKAGVGQILNSPEAQAACMELAEQIAGNVSVKDGVDVIVRPYNSDRAGASVFIAHPGGLGMQAKHGALSRAAASVGLTVKPR
ncbi:hypothetical protein FFI94_018860 [Rhodococcus sp. KBS0724]|uniref:hypothetical protein n=1 Tax=Rhodococcus sp. KBS0724 TaxID=1179674 RepID=UPI00110E5B68|nr:hypothetical protein [Rhodococcus sp. KBS0724]TSD47978.1 hypothetical protein FFI94_018860 [Rhodococcus sp. KBS0724]